VQDIVTDLLDQQGDAGTFVKKTLDAEGYWGDWTLHSSPSPAHASFRLTTALRLYHTFPARSEPGRAASEDDMNTASRGWRDTIMGYAEYVSEANESACGETILEICRVAIERAENGLKILQEEGGGEGWYGKCLRRSNSFGWRSFGSHGRCIRKHTGNSGGSAANALPHYTSVIPPHLHTFIPQNGS